MNDKKDIDPKFRRVTRIWDELKSFKDFLNERETESWTKLLSSFDRFLSDIKNRNRSPHLNKDEAGRIGNLVSQAIKTLSNRLTFIVEYQSVSASSKKSDFILLQELAGLVDRRLKGVPGEYGSYFANAGKTLRTLIETINKKIEREDKNILAEEAKKREDEENLRRINEAKAQEDAERFKAVTNGWATLFSISEEMFDGGACMLRTARGHTFQFSELIELRKGSYSKRRPPFFKETKDPGILNLSFFSYGKFQKLRLAQFKEIFEQVKLLFPRWNPRFMQVGIHANHDLTYDDGWKKLLNSIGQSNGAKNSFFISSYENKRFLISKDRDSRDQIMRIDIIEFGLVMTFRLESPYLGEVKSYVDDILSFFAGRITPKRDSAVAFNFAEFSLNT